MNQMNQKIISLLYGNNGKLHERPIQDTAVNYIEISLVSQAETVKM